MAIPIPAVSATIPESALQPLVWSLWPADLSEAASAACELVEFTLNMLLTAHLPDTEAQRDDKLTAFGHTFLNGDTKASRAAACHDKIRQLLPEFRKACKESGMKLPEVWGIRVGSVVELAVVMWEVAKDKYFIPAIGSKVPYAAGRKQLCLRGNQGPAVEECRCRLKTLHLFNADNLCQLIHYEIGIAAQLRVTPSAQDEGTRVPAADSTAYRPASEFIESPRFVDHKAINKVLEDNSWIRWRRPKGKNGNEILNRKEIHAGDWHKFKTQNLTVEKSAIEPIDMPAKMVDAALEMSRRKEQIDRENLEKLKNKGRK